MAQLSVRAVDVLTHMNDNNRSGANTSETILTPSNVNQTQFGKLWNYTVSGATYAQPLYVSGVNISGGTHNVVYIATMEDMVYAFDADSNTQYWSKDLATGTFVPVPIADITGNNNLNIVGNVGVEGAPYIDKSGGTIYVVSRAKDTGNSSYHQYLHAMDITTGAEKFGGPKEITASGFDPKKQNQRMGLAKAGSNIIITWTSHEDIQPYHGWMMAYNATTLAQAGVFNDTPSGSQGGIWQQGRAPAVDASGNVYVITGNGTWDGSANFGESFLKLSSSLSRLDWFTPDNWSSLNGSDSDLGSSGAMLIPGTSLVIGGGKEGKLYVCNTGNLGHEQSGNGQIVQSISGFGSGQLRGGTVYWNSSANGQLIFDWASGDKLKSRKFNGSTIGATFQTSSAGSPGLPGGFLSVSANGGSSGVVWATLGTASDDHGVVGGIVRAYNADNVGGTELWDSQQNSSRDSMGNFVKDCNPTIANGKVYVGSYSSKVTVYGLLGGGGGGGVNSLAINFSGTGTAMATTELAGVVTHSHWNNEAALSGNNVSLMDNTGATSTATLTWNDPKSVSATTITDTAGNNRMMKNYLDASDTTTTTVTLSSLPANTNGYKVYVYFDGNNTETREGQYTISGTGITTTVINGFDNANTDFSGTFTQANNNAGNYVVFTIGNVSGFTVSATALANGAAFPRAPINGLQIIPQ